MTLPNQRRLRDLPWPMMLTLSRLLLVPVFLYLLVSAAPDRAGSTPADAIQLHEIRWIALGVFAIMAITDKLDGFLARKLNQVSKLGIFLDPTADKILITGGFLLLTFPRFAPAGLAIPWPVLLGVYMKDVCVLIGAAVVKHKLGKVEINANRWGKLNTVVEVVLVLSTMLAPEWVAISPTFAALLMWCLWYLTVFATAASGMGYSVEGARQLRRASESPGGPGA